MMQLTPVSFPAALISENLALGVAALSPFNCFKSESLSSVYVVDLEFINHIQLSLHRES